MKKGKKHEKTKDAKTQRSQRPFLFAKSSQKKHLLWQKPPGCFGMFFALQKNSQFPPSLEVCYCRRSGRQGCWRPWAAEDRAALVSSAVGAGRSVFFFVLVDESERKCDNCSKAEKDGVWFETGFEDFCEFCGFHEISNDFMSQSRRWNIQNSAQGRESLEVCRLDRKFFRVIVWQFTLYIFV